MFRFNRTYCLLAIFLLAIEIIIALYFHDRIIRPYVGDLLVVILVYCSWKSFFNTPVVPTAIGVLLFAFFVEWLQYINFIVVVGLQDSKVARTIIGYSFEWIDIIAYMIGAAIVISTEYLKRRIKRGNTLTLQKS